MDDLTLFLDAYKLKIVLLLAFGFVFASIFGYIALRIRLSPILGYLLAGYLIGPYSPGFVADIETSEELAEIGVILMMFGVGLDFKLSDLIKVKNIAIPGAIGQTLGSTILCTGLTYLLGWPLVQGMIIGLSIGVASTVVLSRMLEENDLLHTKEGHIAVGWLIVEDLFTVIILLILPSFADFNHESNFLVMLSIIVLKFLALSLIFLTGGTKIVSFLLSKVLDTKSNELFTLSVLALVFAIAVSTTFFFGISIALGSFIAGMVIRQTSVHEKALKHSLALKHTFIAIFFLSVGMIFNPAIILTEFSSFIVILGIILIAKPIIAFLISISLNYPFKTALLIGICLAQIGEFSFILMEEALKLKLMPDDGYDLIVACSLVSIALNPLIFKIIHTSSLRKI